MGEKIRWLKYTISFLSLYLRQECQVNTAEIVRVRYAKLSVQLWCRNCEHHRFHRFSAQSQAKITISQDAFSSCCILYLAKIMTPLYRCFYLYSCWHSRKSVDTAGLLVHFHVHCTNFIFMYQSTGEKIMVLELHHFSLPFLTNWSEFIGENLGSEQ